MEFFLNLIAFLIKLKELSSSFFLQEVQKIQKVPYDESSKKKVLKGIRIILSISPNIVPFRGIHLFYKKLTTKT